jgi:uncharacterized protein YjbI with pentapeptide repeats
VAAISIAATAAPFLVASARAKVSQEELNDAIVSHGNWLRDLRTGKRADFSERDLSGLRFSNEQTKLVNLRGADFTAADMTGVTGGDVSFLRASLHDAHLSSSRFERVCFIHASLRRARCSDVVWGWDAASMREPGRVDPYHSSGFQHTDASHADFSRATIRGFFNEGRSRHRN